LSETLALVRSNDEKIGLALCGKIHNLEIDLARACAH
jgi:hypothetical protein